MNDLWINIIYDLLINQHILRGFIYIFMEIKIKHGVAQAEAG